MVKERTDCMFVIIRLIFGGLLLSVLFILIKKSKTANKRLACMISAVITLAFICILTLFPLENVLVTFTTPESAFKYVNMEPDVKLSVYGENTCLIIGEKSGVSNILIIPKSEKGWNIDVGKNTKMINQKVYDSIAVSVYQHTQTGDCYISVMDTNGNEIQLSDNCNSSFMVSEKSNNALNKTYFRYYAYISDYDEDYQLVLNGRAYYLQEDI